MVAAALERSGCSTVFGVPGGGPNLDLIGALERHGVRFVLAHTESGAAMMASACGLVSGVPSAVIVTRGPGAASVVNGTAQATLDRSPLVVITDSVPMSSRDRTAHQRFDQREVMRPVALRTARVGNDVTVDELDGLIAVASGPRPGAIHIDLDASAPTDIDPDREEHSEVRYSTQAVVSELIRRSRTPVVIAGMHAPDGIAECLEEFGAPVLATYQAVGVLPEGHHLNAGLFTNSTPERELLESADLVILIGFDEVEPLPGSWPAACDVVAIDAVPTTHRFAPVTAHYLGHPEQVLEVSARSHDVGSGHVQRLRARLADAARPLGPVATVRAAAEMWPESGVLTVDAGAHFLAVLPFWPVTRRRQLLISNGLSTMGYALPAAIGAAIADPERPVMACTGDGGLHMVLAELETLSRLQLPVCVTVFNDSALTLIRLKQRDGQGGGTAVQYGVTDFAAVARAMGMSATVVDDSRQLHDAFLDAYRHGGPYLVDVRLDPSEYEHIIRVSRG